MCPSLEECLAEENLLRLLAVNNLPLPVAPFLGLEQLFHLMVAPPKSLQSPRDRLRLEVEFTANLGRASLLLAEIRNAVVSVVNDVDLLLGSEMPPRAVKQLSHL